MADSLEQVLEEALKEAGVLREHGHQDQADTLERLVTKVRASAAQYLDWLPEQDAMLYTGRSVEWLRRRFKEWEERGVARWHHGRRQYRRIILEHRGNAEAAREAGKRAAMGLPTKRQRVR